MWLYRGPSLVASGRSVTAGYDRQSGNGTAATVTFHFAPSGRAQREGGRAARGVDVVAGSVAGNLHAQVADASGGVTVRTGVGDTAKTPTAHYAGAGRVASGHGGVVVTGTHYRLTAPEFRLSLPDEHLELAGGVQGRTEGSR